LQPSDVADECVQEALKEYQFLQIEGCRPIKTYKSALKALDEMDNYFESIDFTKTDKQGKLLYTPNQFTNNISAINVAYEELEKLKKKIKEQLKKSSGIRGSATLGDKEINKKKETWEEGSNTHQQEVNWMEFGQMLKH
jgi:histidyl-tRNA synthetase